jgi:hypothetical protein
MANPSDRPWRKDKTPATTGIFGQFCSKLRICEVNWGQTPFLLMAHPSDRSWRKDKTPATTGIFRQFCAKPSI